MPKLIAVHEIVRGPQNKREVIDPKTEFDATEKEAEELLAAGVAVVAEAKPKKAAVVAEAKPKTEFDATEKEAEELLAAGAAVVAEAKPKKAAVVAEAKPKKAAAKTDDVI